MSEAASSRERLIRAGTELIRSRGYAGTSVGEICSAAGVSKGAFFHHFSSKEDLATSCLARWEEWVTSLHASAPYRELEDPVERARACMSFMIEMFEGAGPPPSCLAGVTAQEASVTNEALREAAHACFASAEAGFAALLEEAFAGREVDSSSLASLWVATLQGALLLAKASGDRATIVRSLAHVKRYIEGLLDAPREGDG